MTIKINNHVQLLWLIPKPLFSLLFFTAGERTVAFVVVLQDSNVLCPRSEQACRSFFFFFNFMILWLLSWNPKQTFYSSSSASLVIFISWFFAPRNIVTHKHNPSSSFYFFLGFLVCPSPPSFSFVFSHWIFCLVPKTIKPPSCLCSLSLPKPLQSF